MIVTATQSRELDSNTDEVGHDPCRYDFCLGICGGDVAFCIAARLCQVSAAKTEPQSSVADN